MPDTALRSPSTGAIVQIADADLEQALAAGMTPVSAENAAQAAAEAEYGGVGGALAAGGLGALRGATLGLSDTAIEGIGGERIRKALEGYKTANPLASGVGEVVGTIAPALVGDEAGLIGAGVKAVGAPVRAVTAVGELAGGTVAKALGSRLGGSALGRIGTKALAEAADYGVQGAAFSLGHEISDEAVFADHELTAEHVLTAMGGGFLFGGALGGLTGGAIGTLGEGGRAIAGGARALSTKTENAIRGVLGDGKTAVEGTSTWGKTATEAFEGAETKLSDLVTSKVDLQKMSDELAFRSLGGGTEAGRKFAREAEQRGGGTARVGRTLKETGVISKEDGILGNALTHEDLLPRVEAARETVGKALGDIAETSTSVVKIGEIAEALEANIAPLREIAGREGVVSSLEAYRNSLYAKLGAYGEKGELLVDKAIPVQALRKQRIGLQDIAFQESKSLDPAMRVQQLRAIRNSFDDIEVGALVEGGADGAVIGKLKQQYQDLRIAEDYARHSAGNAKTNRMFSLTDYVTGAAFGGGLTGAAAAVVNNVARTRGPAAASMFLEDLARTRSIAATARNLGGEARAKLGELGAQGSMVGDSIHGFDAATAKARAFSVLGQVAETSERVAQQVSTAAKAVVAKGEKAGAAIVKHGLAARQAGYNQGYATVAAYSRRRDEVERAVSNPQIMQGAMERRMSGLGTHAPQIAGQLAMKANAALQHAASQLPPRGTDPNSLTPMADRFRDDSLTANEARFMRTMRALDNPMSVLEDAKEGRLSKEGVDVLRIAYPKIYRSLRESVAEAIAERKEPLPWATQLSLAGLLGIPTSRLMTPEFLRAIQPNTSQSNNQESPGTHSPKPLQSREQMASTSERLEGSTHGKRD